MRQHHKNSKYTAFTLVEVLIVIIIIALLALLGYLTFSGVRVRASDSSDKSTAKNIEKFIENYAAVNDSIPQSYDLGDTSWQAANNFQ